VMQVASLYRSGDTPWLYIQPVPSPELMIVYEYIHTHDLEYTIEVVARPPIQHPYQDYFAGHEHEQLSIIYVTPHPETSEPISDRHQFPEILLMPFSYQIKQ
jgi:hypothetical protein